MEVVAKELPLYIRKTPDTLTSHFNKNNIPLNMSASTSQRSKAGGIYDVTEYGVKYRHLPGPQIPKDGEEFLSRLKDDFQLRILEHSSPNEIVFEMVNIDVSLANALRRIMISEVPSMAIEHVYMWNNSSIIHDEVLAHRIGLVPINVDPRYFDSFVNEDDDPTDKNTLVFRLDVVCEREKKSDNVDKDDDDNMLNDNEIKDNSSDKNTVSGNDAVDKVAQQIANELQLQQGGGAGSDDADQGISRETIRSAIETPGRPYTRHIYSSDLKWVPQGAQEEQFPDGIRPVHEDILLAKLRPGQAIGLEAHARKSTGKDHAKYSPVATACYRLMPQVEIVKEVYDDLAEQLDIYEPGVFRIVACTDADEIAKGYKKKAVVDNPYACTMSRNFMRNAELNESVKITRLPNHFIFSVESVGMMPAAVILAESIKVLKEKCQNIVRLVDETMEGEGIIS